MSKRFDLPDGGWAERKTCWDVTRKERRDMYLKLSETGTDDDPADGDVVVMLTMLTEWSRPEPISEENINALSVPLANVLATEAVAFMREMSPDFTPEAMADPKAGTSSSAD